MGRQRECIEIELTSNNSCRQKHLLKEMTKEAALNRAKARQQNISAKKCSFFAESQLHAALKEGRVLTRVEDAPGLGRIFHAESSEDAYSVFTVEKRRNEYRVSHGFATMIVFRCNHLFSEAVSIRPCAGCPTCCHSPKA